MRKIDHDTEYLNYPRDGFWDFQSYYLAEVPYGGAVFSCVRFISCRSRTHDQMVQAARGGKQNLAEGTVASGTSKKTELKLAGIARASLEELLVDFKDFLRQKGLPLWGKDHPNAREVRGLCYRQDRSYETYRTYIEKAEAEVAANTLVCLIHQANYLLDQQLRALEKDFLKEGGFTERLYRTLTQARGPWKKP